MKSALAGPVGYVINEWTALTRFLDDGALHVHGEASSTRVERTALLAHAIAKIQTEQWPHGRLRDLVPRRLAQTHALIAPKRRR